MASYCKFNLFLETFCDHIAVAIGHCEKNESGQHQMSEGINRLQALQQQLAMAEQRENDTTKEQGRAKFMMELSKSLHIFVTQFY